MKRLLHHRLPADPTSAQQEWAAIVEGRHPLWEGIGLPYRHTVRAFLVHFQVQILRHATETFDLCNGSIGNFFFAGARIWFRSLDAAIFLYSRVSGIPPESHVLPAICTESAIALGCELDDGTMLIGQNAISHPPRQDRPTSVEKDAEALPSRVRRVFYTASGAEGPRRGLEELLPAANPAVLSALARADAVIFGMGSLFTSLVPSLILDGIGEAVAALPPAAPRILCLNGSRDRETTGLDASGCVAAVVAALRRRGAPASMAATAPDMAGVPLTAFVTHVLYPEAGALPVDTQALLALGVHVVPVASAPLKDSQQVGYEPVAFVEALQGVLSGSN